MSSEHEVILSSLSSLTHKKINNILEIGTFDGVNSFLLSLLFKKSMSYKVRNNPRITVSLKADAESKMGLITSLHKLLQDPDVNALKLNYSALRKSE